MATRKPLRAPARDEREGAALNPVRFPTRRPRYTPELLADVRRRFEDTTEPIPSLAADLGVEPESLHRIARRRGWVRHVPAPARDIPQALRILREAQALDAGDASAAPEVSPAAASLGGSAEAAAPGPEQERAATPASPKPSTIDRLERAVLAELATIEAMRTTLGTLPQKSANAARTVRTLSLLTQTLQHLQRLRAGQALQARTGLNDHDDDMPRDIEQFRRDLARRIDAFVASRTDASGGGGDADEPGLDRS